MVPIFVWYFFVLCRRHFEYLDYFLYLVVENNLQAVWNVFLKVSMLGNAILAVVVPFALGVRASALQIIGIS